MMQTKVDGVMYVQVLSLFFRSYQFKFYKLILGSLEAYMVINFKVCEINWDARKLIRTRTLIKK